ncbi:MAG: type II toxin-antitoxin system VapC family toxin [Candidatus Poribacteria bacterium]|nr:type II toxin-antitoxin system VapC family toxin [Candidatus Poribacteria bacterium]
MSLYLLDTHALLWTFDDNPTLSDEARKAIDTGDVVYASVVSVWEIVIKKALGKLDAPEDLGGAILTTGLTPLFVTIAHALAVGKLPRHESHKDPFDRLLVAQTKVKGLTLITRDEDLKKYDIPILDA